MNPRSTIADLIESGLTVEFFQALRLVERLQSDRQPVGGDASPEKESVRLIPQLSLLFPTSDVHSIRAPDHPEHDERFQMVVNFMGLYGPSGVLPMHYTELLLERRQARDHALRDFMDIFNHRLISLFFRAHEKYRYASGRNVENRDTVSSSIGAFLGDEPGFQRSVEGEPTRSELLRYAGLFSQRPRSVVALEAVLGDYFDSRPIAVRQFVNRWVSIDRDDQGRVGGTRGSNQLGRTLIIGARVFDRQGKFRVRVGPLGFEDFLAFQPGGRYHGPVCRLVREFAGDHLQFDVQPVLRAAEVPALQLAGLKAGLGRTTWLLSRPRREDGDEAAFRPEVSPARGGLHA